MNTIWNWWQGRKRQRALTRLHASMGPVKTDADLEREAALWESWGDDETAALLRGAAADVAEAEQLLAEAARPVATTSDLPLNVSGRFKVTDRLQTTVANRAVINTDPGVRITPGMWRALGTRLKRRRGDR